MKANFIKWLKCAGVRALKTFSQTFLSFITVGLAISDINWANVLSVSLVALIYSLLTSVAGLPELKEESEE